MATDERGTGRLTIPHFQARWRGVTLTERAAAHSHFNDLCEALGVPRPLDLDRTGTFYAFEKGVEKLGGGKGFADVWYLNHFAWEYKGRHKDLEAAYRQLVGYKDDLENPPLLITCDLDRIEVRTNFTGTRPKKHVIALDELDRPDKLAILRAVWEDPAKLRPDVLPEVVTRQAAERFGAIAAAMRGRGVEAHRAAHFLVQLLFCLFAEDVGLLPRGLFAELLANSIAYPDRFPTRIGSLLAAMRDGGDYGHLALARFNGGLFAETEGRRVGESGSRGVGETGGRPEGRGVWDGETEGPAPAALTVEELKTLAEATKLDWSAVEPAIFGTLFERSLDPGTRAQLGAHYTRRADIERVIEPVLMAPLRRRWAAVRAEADALKTAWEETAGRQRGRAAEGQRGRGAETRARERFAAKLFGFQEELAAVRVLDPACGSGNFLYVALAALKDLELEVSAYAAANGLPGMFLRVGPGQLAGLEVNAYARELAQVVIWIGYLQWMAEHAYQPRLDPVLDPLDSIRLQDALLDRSDPAHPKEAVWPAADVIVGNPPFLGGKRIRAELGDAYTEDLHRAFVGRLPPFADLVCYFFEKAREQIKSGHSRRAGMLATNSIRGGANRAVLDRIKRTGDIFMAWEDEPWVLDGAAVRISIVGFDDGSETEQTLNGAPVSQITSALTAGADLSSARRLAENAGIGFIGDQPTGAFDVQEDRALRWIELPPNPFGRSNSDVLRLFYSGSDITGRWSRRWIVDFGVDTPVHEAAMYEAPFEHVRAHVQPERAKNSNRDLRNRWWLHWRPRAEMRAAVAANCSERFLCTPHVSKHRVWTWLPVAVLPNNLLIVFARDDDDFFGVLHSRAHEVWSLRMGTWVGVGNDPRYTPTTCFETFPFPRPDDAQRAAIAAAAKALDEARRRWLDPPETPEAELKKRTLTNLYNQRPTWLANLHRALDRAVWAAYDWADDPAETPDEAILARLLALNLARAAPEA